MTEMTTVALDAMGGDNAPGEIVKGAVSGLWRIVRISMSVWLDRRKWYAGSWKETGIPGIRSRL